MVGISRREWLGLASAAAFAGEAKRGSPYNDNYQPKRLRTAIADAFGAAPMRG